MSSPMNLGSSGTSPSAVDATSASEGPFKSAGQLRSGSVMDILGGEAGSKSPEAASPSPKPAAQLKQDSVMDILGGKGEWIPV